MLTLIENANVLAGDKIFQGFVVLKDEKILRVGREKPAGVVFDLKIDGKGKVLSPGFIDSHSHSDLSCLAAPECYGKISQGVTSEIIGNCGLSAFPLTDLNREHLQQLYENYNEKLDWSTLASYLQKVKERDVAVNIFALCGHNSLRAAVAGYQKRDLSGSELDMMQKLLADCLQSGALGLSSGLLYVPGIFAAMEEITSLLKIVAAHGGIYATHLRSEGNEIIRSLHEACECAKLASLPRLHISHLKIAGAQNHHKINEVMKIFENAQIPMTCDRYPYTESMTQLSVILAAPFDVFDDVSLQRKLQDREFSSKVLRSLRALPRQRYNSVRLLSTNSAQYADFAGQSLADIARCRKISTPELCLDILRRDAPGALAAFRGMSEANMHKIVTRDYCVCASDESARPTDYSIGRSHPRGFGSFPRFFEILRSENFSVAQVVYKMTGLPARIFGLPLRGQIKTGFFADLVLFDPDKFKSTADFTNPHQTATGIEKVWINGRLKFQR